MTYHRNAGSAPNSDPTTERLVLRCVLLFVADRYSVVSLLASRVRMREKVRIQLGSLDSNIPQLVVDQIAAVMLSIALVDIFVRKPLPLADA